MLVQQQQYSPPTNIFQGEYARKKININDESMNKLRSKTMYPIWELLSNFGKKSYSKETDKKMAKIMHEHQSSNLHGIRWQHFHFFLGKWHFKNCSKFLLEWFLINGDNQPRDNYRWRKFIDNIFFITEPFVFFFSLFKHAETLVKIQKDSMWLGFNYHSAWL